MLTADNYEILKALGNTDGGYSPSSIRVRCGVWPNRNQRMRAAYIRQCLLHMKKEGLVEYLDDKKPICWKLTDKGAEAQRTRDRKDI